MSTGTEEVVTSRTTTPRPHLYLILDDWETGYSFRMVDLSSHHAGWQVPGGMVPGGIPRQTATYLPPRLIPPERAAWEAQALHRRWLQDLGHASEGKTG